MEIPRIPIMMFSACLITFGIVAASPPLGVPVLGAIGICGFGSFLLFTTATHGEIKNINKIQLFKFFAYLGLAMTVAGTLSLIPFFGLALPANIILMVTGLATLLISLGALWCLKKRKQHAHRLFKEKMQSEPVIVHYPEQPKVHYFQNGKWVPN